MGISSRVIVRTIGGCGGGGAARWEARSRAVMGRRRVFKLRRDGARDATTDECTRRDSIVGDTRRLD